MEHAELIARLGAAPEGSRELDEEIASHIAGATLERQAGGRAAYHRDGLWVSVGKVLPYTTALDAALTLVPPGMWWTVAAGKLTPNEPLFGAAIYRPELFAALVPVAVGKHPTSAPIALCIAALGSPK